MGHHSAAYTLDTYGHLIDGDLGAPLDPASCAGAARPAPRWRQARVSDGASGLGRDFVCSFEVAPLGMDDEPKLVAAG